VRKLNPWAPRVYRVLAWVAIRMPALRMSSSEDITAGDSIVKLDYATILLLWLGPQANICSIIIVIAIHISSLACCSLFQIGFGSSFNLDIFYCRLLPLHRVGWVGERAKYTTSNYRSIELVTNATAQWPLLAQLTFFSLNYGTISHVVNKSL
jgi:hypothetical protein